MHFGKNIVDMNSHCIKSRVHDKILTYRGDVKFGLVKAPSAAFTRESYCFMLFASHEVQFIPLGKTVELGRKQP